MTASEQSVLDDGQDPVLRTAIQWHIDLDERPDDAELRRAFARWQADDESHAAAADHAGRVLGLIEHTKSVSPLSARSATEIAPTRKAKIRRPARVFAAVAAAAALVAVLAPDIALRLRSDYMTTTAQQRLVSLEDGSTVRLAPGSAVDVDYNGNRRAVRLLSGEAYFEVARNPARPFEVSAGAANVTVLGTGFNVRLGDESANVAVKHGRVRVDYADGLPPVSAVLGPGEWRRLAWNGATTGGATSPALVGGWSENRLTAVDRPLSDVIADVRRYYGGAIILTDSALGERIVTGSYDMRDPAAALATIVGPLDAKVRTITPWLIVVS